MKLDSAKLSVGVDLYTGIPIASYLCTGTVTAGATDLLQDVGDSWSTIKTKYCLPDETSTRLALRYAKYKEASAG